jgi:hypothetical protein
MEMGRKPFNPESCRTNKMGFSFFVDRFLFSPDEAGNPLHRHHFSNVPPDDG